MQDFDHHKRSSDGCLCCGSTSLRTAASLVSPFLAQKAWSGPTELTSLLECCRCRFRFFDRGLSPEETERYYKDFGSEEYFRARNQFEPFYTRRVYEGDREWAHTPQRRIALASVLEQAGAPSAFAAALDFGGGTGHMLAGIQAARKAVFDLCDAEPEPGVANISSAEEIGLDWDLVLNCHVLEHTSDPLQQVREIAQILSKGGWLYAEVPDQNWKRTPTPRLMNNAWISFVAKRPRALLAADIVSTGFRVKTGWLPPFGFVPMREHINFFTADALAALLTRAGLQVRSSGTNLVNSIYALGTRPLS